MQDLWAKTLAGEANAPGKFSKRTVNLLATLDKSDADLFCTLCSYVWHREDNSRPIIYDEKDQIYAKAGINFVTLTHLQTIGLISFSPIDDHVYGWTRLPLETELDYYGSRVKIRFRRSNGNTFDTGRVIFSKAGQELESVSGSTPRDGFKAYVMKEWQKLRYKVSEVS